VLGSLAFKASERLQGAAIGSWKALLPCGRICGYGGVLRLVLADPEAVCVLMSSIKVKFIRHAEYNWKKHLEVMLVEKVKRSSRETYGDTQGC